MIKNFVLILQLLKQLQSYSKETKQEENHANEGSGGRGFLIATKVHAYQPLGK